MLLVMVSSISGEETEDCSGEDHSGERVAGNDGQGLRAAELEGVLGCDDGEDEGEPEKAGDLYSA